MLAFFQFDLIYRTLWFMIMIMIDSRYLAVANNYDGVTSNVDSVLYRWNSTRMAFEEHQRHAKEQ